MGTQVRAARRVAATLAVALLLTAGGLSAEAATPAAAPVSQSVVDPGGVPGVGLPGRSGATVNGCCSWYLTYFSLTMSKALAKAAAAGSTAFSVALYAIALGPIVAAAVVAGIYAFVGNLSQSRLDACATWSLKFTYTGRLISATCSVPGGGNGGGTW